jgi:hypothetical protein
MTKPKFTEVLDAYLLVRTQLDKHCEQEKPCPYTAAAINRHVIEAGKKLNAFFEPAAEPEKAEHDGLLLFSMYVSPEARRFWDEVKGVPLIAETHGGLCVSFRRATLTDFATYKARVLDARLFDKLKQEAKPSAPFGMFDEHGARIA